MDVRALREQLGTHLAGAEAARSDVRRTSTALLAARRTGASDAVRLERELRAAEQRLREAETLAERLRERLVPRGDPVAHLAAEHPIALLPVRVETRFAARSAHERELLVRIYPDEIHVDDHEPGLSDAELGAAERYWQRIWRAGIDDLGAERAAFVELAGRTGVTRAVWVSRATEPDPAGRPPTATPDGELLAQSPVLRAAARSGAGFARPATAGCMPDRWFVLAYRDGVEVARAAGALVPDRLQVGPSPLGPPLDAPAEDGPPLEPELRWLWDFAAAEERGLGIRLPLASGGGLDRVLVVGVRGSLDAAASAARLSGLLEAHRYSRGLGFIRQGTPTNNTDRARAGWSVRATAEEAFALERSARGGEAGNAAAAARALGLDASIFERLEQALEPEQQDARQFQLALWPATLGYYLEVLLAPHFDDAQVALIRQHFTDHVRARGPLPCLRVGPQPYGLLPVTSLSLWRPRPTDEPVHVELVSLLGRLVPEWLARARSLVPRVGRPERDPDQELLAILARDALSQSYAVRRARGPVLSRAAAILLDSPLDPAGPELVEAVLELLGLPNLEARLRGFEHDARSAVLRRPLVHAGALSETEPVPAHPGGASNYLSWLADCRERAGSAFAGPDAGTLLFSILRHSLRLSDAEAALRLSDARDLGARKARLEAEVVDQAGSAVTLGSLLSQPVSAISRGTLGSVRPVGEFLASVTRPQILALGRPHVVDAYDRAQELRSAVRALATRPSAVLDRLLRETLDLCSHRLDAWVTSIATRRLEQLRLGAPTGLHLGGYAWVEDLQPRPRATPVASPPAGEVGVVEDPGNAGFVHGPSLAHAAAAAVLRSGHLSHARAGQADGPLAIDLSSERTRLGLWLVDGIRQGQPLGALLGYRFERGLHERSRPGLELDRFIRPLRALAPLVVGRRESVAASVGSVEAVGASNVVDGLAILRRWQATPASLDPALTGASAAERAGVRAELAALGDAVDAVADLLLAEATYQLTSGNPTRAAASLDALGSGLLGPPELDVVTTPSPGLAHTYRVLVVLPASSAPAPGWEAGAQRPRRLAEPRLERWVAGLFGPPSRIGAAARFRDSSGNVIGVRSATLEALGLCALDLVYDGADAPDASPLEVWVLEHIARVAAPEMPAGVRAELVHVDDLDWPREAWPADALPFEDALALGSLVRELLSGSRAASGQDLAPPAAPAAWSADAVELAGRAAAAESLLEQAAAELGAALAALAATDAAAGDRLRHALFALSGFSIGSAAEALRRQAESGAELSEEMRRARLVEAAAAVLSEIDALRARLQAAAASPFDRLRGMLGDGFVALPLLASADPAALAAAVTAGSDATFLDNDPAAPLGWLQRVGRVRERVGRLGRILLAAAQTGWREQLAVAQLPLAARWVALPFEGAQPPASATCLVLCSSEPVSPDAGSLAALLVDEWVEVVPSPRLTTGVAFHFDAPGARPPQAVLLAVHPDPVRNWSLESLARVVYETADLAHVRMVGPAEVPWLGRFLPALYFADNPEGHTLSPELGRLAEPEVQP